eukprot:1916884-Pleurochrysis_carterae.AAC.1
MIRQAVRRCNNIGGRLVASKEGSRVCACWGAAAATPASYCSPRPTHRSRSAAVVKHLGTFEQTRFSCPRDTQSHPPIRILSGPEAPDQSIVVGLVLVCSLQDNMAAGNAASAQSETGHPYGYLDGRRLIPISLMPPHLVKWSRAAPAKLNLERIGAIRDELFADDLAIDSEMQNWTEVQVGCVGACSYDRHLRLSHRPRQWSSGSEWAEDADRAAGSRLFRVWRFEPPYRCKQGRAF